ncbi:MAG: PqqD family peptide modification chaperone [Candidatus Aenigmarchaeota archaeon]|nr:PqqD family peptide modification chaperone [Candidatus Aenigmarchaeota archaeon]
MQKFRRRGSVGKTDDGLVMINDQDESVPVDEMIIMVWNLCDGQDEQSVVSMLMSKVKADREPVEAAIRHIIKELVNFGMLEAVE